MCDNSPVFEAAPRSRKTVRTAIWCGMKQDRVCTVPGSLVPGFTFADYADYIMSREAILVPDQNAPEGWRYVADKTFDECYADPSKAKELLGWEAERNLEDMCRDTYRFQQQNPDGYRTAE